MTLSDQDEKFIELLAERIVFKVNKIVIKRHIESCPIGKKITKIWNILIGIAIGFGICGFGGGFTVAKLFF